VSMSRIDAKYKAVPEDGDAVVAGHGAADASFTPTVRRAST
jgi:hypothetical protein